MAHSTVLAAIDLGPSTARVLYHASGFARLLGADLRVLHVAASESATVHDSVHAACLQLAPYEQDFADEQIVIRRGRVSDAIAREARASQAMLVVMGSRRHKSLMRFLLGSTSEAVLRNATVPVLLVPPIDIDIVNVGDGVALSCGPVSAAVDLAEDSRAQLEMASRIAALGSQPLLLMTVAKSRVTDHAAAVELRARARGLAPVKPRAVLVRRGAVAEEISRCAVAEGAAWVILGLKGSARGRPGAIASAVLRTNRAFVLAVPPTRPVVAEEQPRRALDLAVITTLLVMAIALAAPLSFAQERLPDVRAIVDFQRAADAYAFMHRQVEMRLQLAHRGWQDSDPVSTAELAAAIAARRPVTAPRLFTPRVSAAFREMAARASRAAACDPGELRSGAWEMRHDVNTPATGTTPLAPCIQEALPQLPDELEYRSSGTMLVIVDSHANLVVDVLPGLLAGSELRDDTFFRR